MSKEISQHLRESVGYHIYPRSFQDSNGDGTGDLPGIHQRLDYLQHTLGIDTVYFSPFYPSPGYDFGYDVSDYRDVDRIFGSLDDAKNLFTEMHSRGMKVIVDFIPNHTSHEHTWFQESASSKSNPKRDWYTWRKGRGQNGELPPNNWFSVINDGTDNPVSNSAWTRHPATNEWYLHSFLPQQPDIDWRNPKVRQEMLDTMRFWYDTGADGIRVDAVFWLGKDARLRDEPLNPRYKPGIDDPWTSLTHRYSMNHPNMWNYIEDMADVASEFKDRFIIPEAYTQNIHLMMEFYKHCKERGAPFNFNLITRPLDASIAGFIDRFQKALGPNDVPIYVLGNHDNSRVVTRMGGEKGAKTAALLLTTLPGTPFIYYGDEIGMKDVPIPPDRMRDPHGIKHPELGIGRDPERTPMQWDNTPNAGFTQEEAEPWLPIGADYQARNVEVQLKNSGSILNLHRNIIDLRRNSAALTSPHYEPVYQKGKSVMAYIRRDTETDEALLTVLNFSTSQQKISLPFGVSEVLIATEQNRDRTLDLNKFTMQESEGLVLRVA